MRNSKAYKKSELKLKIYKWYNFNDYFLDGIKSNYLYFSSKKEMQGVNDGIDGVIFTDIDFNGGRYFCASYVLNSAFSSRDLCVCYRTCKLEDEIKRQNLWCRPGFIDYVKNAKAGKQFESKEDLKKMFQDPYGLGKHLNRMQKEFQRRSFEKDEKYKDEREFRLITFVDKLYFKNYDYIDMVYIKPHLFENKTKEFKNFLRFLRQKNIKFCKYVEPIK